MLSVVGRLLLSYEVHGCVMNDDYETTSFLLFSGHVWATQGYSQIDTEPHHECQRTSIQSDTVSCISALARIPGNMQIPKQMSSCCVRV